MMDVTVRGLDKLRKNLKTEGRRQEKALETAVKVEGFRLMRQMRKEIAQGSPGGRKFSPLTFLSRRWHEKGSTRLRPDKPFMRTRSGSSIVRAVRYHIQSRKPFDMRVGFSGPRLSSAWKRIAKAQQEGFTHGMSDFKRSFFRYVAGKLGPRAAGKKYLLIKKTTRTFRTPARPIVEPFWETHKTEAIIRIRNNFRRKMRGERI